MVSTALVEVLLFFLFPNQLVYKWLKLKEVKKKKKAIQISQKVKRTNKYLPCLKKIN